MPQKPVKIKNKIGTSKNKTANIIQNQSSKFLSIYKELTSKNLISCERNKLFFLLKKIINIAKITQTKNWILAKEEALEKSKSKTIAWYIATSKVVEFGPPPRVNATEKLEIHIKKIIQERLGKVALSIGNSISLK